MLVVFDIDGTLANIEHRLDYVRSKPKNWKAFDAGIPNDAVNAPVAEAFHALKAAGNTIIFASGRSDRTRADTMEWLQKHNLWNYSAKLYMRKDGDFRNDSIVKDEIIDEIVEDFGQLPDMWFDDRPRVVRAVRARGIFVFDVYQGEEDF
jgi:phosphoglycolate phosphatase-like HAD superfamily hydrolase